MEKHARIVSFDEFNQLRDKLGRIVCTSGGFRPAPSRSCILHNRFQAIWGYPCGGGKRG